MPSGYTQPLYDGEEVSFENFVLRCSRAMGAAVMQRDEPLSEPIRLRKADTSYAEKRLADYHEQLAKAEAMTDEEAAQESMESFKRQVDFFYESNLVRQERVNRYEAMLRQVEAWEPPTADHQGLKDFMIQQLEDSIDWDGPTSLGHPVPRTGREYRAILIEEAERGIERELEAIEKEQQRVKEQNEWVTALVEALGGTVE